MAAKRRNSSKPASGKAKKASTVTLASYLHGCDEKPDIFFVAGEAGQMQVTFPAHTAKFETLPDRSFLRGIDGMPSDEPVSLPSGVTADGFCNLLWVLYGKDMALSEDNWPSTFVTYALLNMTETDFEARLLCFAKSHMSTALALSCLGICIKFPQYKSPFDEISWKCIDCNRVSIFMSPNFLNVEWALLLRILERDSLRVRREITVYRAAVKWATESLKRKSEECTDAAIRKELGEALYQIRFSQMPLEDFAAGPGTTEILTDKEKSEICLSRFNKDLTPEAFVLRKRVETRQRNPSVVDGCTLCGHSDDGFIECCGSYLRVPKKAWSKAHCQKCNGDAYRCQCGALNLANFYADECEECRVDVHCCSRGVFRRSRFRKDQSWRECCGVFVSEDD